MDHSFGNSMMTNENAYHSLEQEAGIANNLSAISPGHRDQSSLMAPSMRQKKTKGYMRPTTSSNKKVDITMQSYRRATVKVPKQEYETLCYTLDSMMADNNAMREKLTGLMLLKQQLGEKVAAQMAHK